MQKIKPSTILLKKSGGAKQIRGALFGRYDMKNKRYCALGLLACRGGMIKNDDSFDDIDDYSIAERFGLLKTIKIKRCLVENCNEVMVGEKNEIYNMIMHLNDDHKWTFKQIGEWLRSIGK